MHYLRKDFTQCTQTLRKYIYAGITHISHAYAIILRRYYADITQINYAIITHITHILHKQSTQDLRKITQRLRKSFYACITHNYAYITQKLRK